MRGYLKRFVTTHVVTYLLFGITFMLISQYFDFFQAHPGLSQVMRSSDEIWVRLAPLAQIFRGALLGLAFYPFRAVLNERKGWLKLFFLMWVFTSLGAVITGPGSIEGMLYTTIGAVNPLVGYPEITLQMLAFSYLFAKWEKKKAI